MIVGAFLGLASNFSGSIGMAVFQGVVGVGNEVIKNQLAQMPVATPQPAGVSSTGVESNVELGSASDGVTVSGAMNVGNGPSSNGITQDEIVKRALSVKKDGKLSSIFFKDQAMKQTIAANNVGAIVLAYLDILATKYNVAVNLTNGSDVGSTFSLPPLEQSIAKADGGVTIPKFSYDGKLLNIQIYYSTVALKIPGTSIYSSTDDIVVHELAHAITYIILVNNISGGFIDLSDEKLGTNLLQSTAKKSKALFGNSTRLFQEIRSVFFENLYRIGKGIANAIRNFYDQAMTIDFSQFLKVCSNR